MSFSTLVLDLLTDIDDPAVRMEVSQTLHFLKGVFATGRVHEDQIRDDIYEIVLSVLSLKMVGASREEIEKKAREYVEKFMQAMRLETASSRIMARRSLSTML